MIKPRQIARLIKLFFLEVTQSRRKTIDVSANSLSLPVIQKVDLKTKKTEFVVSAIAINDEEVIAVRSGGKIVHITNGEEKCINIIQGAEDWRGLWKDSLGNIFLSPHSTPSLGSINVSDRGIYKYMICSDKFEKVHSLYDPISMVESERELNDDTIWSFCEDSEGNLYAGVYAHTMRKNPSIYKSQNHGDTWYKLFDFKEAGLTPRGCHIHAICYSKYTNELYALVGEVNDLFKSIDGGHTWEALRVKAELAKGCTLEPVKDGIIIGGDSAYNCVISKYYFDTKTIKTVSRIFGGTVFALRKSDVSDDIYAFTKIDSSVKLNAYYPPLSAIHNKRVLLKWILSGEKNLPNWVMYHLTTMFDYPKDCVRPQHNAILRSTDQGNSWEIIYKIKTTSKGPNGFWVTGYFHKGECLSGFVGKELGFENPFIISENKESSNQGVFKKNIQ